MLIMEQITKQAAIEQLKKEYDEEICYIKSDEYNWVKEEFPKAWKLIQKLDDTIQYVCVEDLQGAEFGVGTCGSAKAWALHICQWAYSDDYEDDYENPEADANDLNTIFLCPLMGYFESGKDVIEIISEIWSIEIKELIK